MVNIGKVLDVDGVINNGLMDLWKELGIMVNGKIINLVELVYYVSKME